MKHKHSDLFNLFSQVLLPTFTLSGQIAYAMKFPEWGLVLNLLAQPFWVYSGYKSYKQAGQIGIFITSVVFTIITIWGVVNYWII